MFVLIILVSCSVFYFISSYFYNLFNKKQNKTNTIEALVFYLFFFRLISVALMVGFVLYWIAGVF
tara:strand:+ start:280 stop:474 length:195 start_codon:yes stop_codon:yes gene_type:complete